MKPHLFAAILAASSLAMNATAAADSAADSVHDFTVTDINGKEVKLSSYQGKALLIVNVASRCGATPQYKQLQAIQERFQDQGLVVLGFPANNYGGQEPGSDEQIKEFCTSKYDVSFPMFSKVSVDGDDQAPLFQYLTAAENPSGAGRIKWNFEKFLVGKDGKLVQRFGTRVKPDAPEVVAAIEKTVAG